MHFLFLRVSIERNIAKVWQKLYFRLKALSDKMFRRYMRSSLEKQIMQHVWTEEETEYYFQSNQIQKYNNY